METTGNDLKVPALSVVSTDGQGEGEKEPVATVKRRIKPGRKPNGVIKGDTRSMYISPGKSNGYRPMTCKLAYYSPEAVFVFHERMISAAV